ncbi:hypothetical protein LX36DRAFT_283321 [Colletotrichum falcatum]|nr:hypothetical protein LX36DRAFT_283321 [Colletotrichum falcatum]
MGMAVYLCVASKRQKIATTLTELFFFFFCFFIFPPLHVFCPLPRLRNLNSVNPCALCCPYYAHATSAAGLFDAVSADGAEAEESTIRDELMHGGPLLPRGSTPPPSRREKKALIKELQMQRRGRTIGWRRAYTRGGECGDSAALRA